jgi:hypothetical protein
MEGFELSSSGSGYCQVGAVMNTAVNFLLKKKKDWKNFETY